MAEAGTVQFFRQMEEVAMKALSMSEVQFVSGGGDVASAVIGWIVGKALDATVDFVGSLNQGGTAFEGGDPTLPGNVYGA
jgi:hypothetical protein